MRVLLSSFLSTLPFLSARVDLSTDLEEPGRVVLSPRADLLLSSFVSPSFDLSTDLEDVGRVVRSRLDVLSVLLEGLSFSLTRARSDFTAPRSLRRLFGFFPDLEGRFSCDSAFITLVVIPSSSGGPSTGKRDVFSLPLFSGVSFLFFSKLINTSPGVFIRSSKSAEGISPRLLLNLEDRTANPSWELSGREKSSNSLQDPLRWSDAFGRFMVC
mmetsp:Transcript_5175/g.8166  ORF Transcript_5175/g.8166 Transcript_5175/m.8166 type:complete len:214 (+) Transcript_5175:1598-2239(+)